MNDVLGIPPYGDRDGSFHWKRVSVRSGENSMGDCIILPTAAISRLWKEQRVQGCIHEEW